MGNGIGKCPFDRSTSYELSTNHVIGVALLTLCVVAQILVALFWWGYQSQNIRIIQENDLRAMQEAMGPGGRRMKPKKPNKKKKAIPEAELDEEDLALIGLDRVRQKKERDFIKYQLRPEAQHPSHLMPGI